MSHFLKLITLTGAVALGSAAFAQDSETPKPQTEAETAVTEAVETVAEAAADTVVDTTVADTTVADTTVADTTVADTTVAAEETTTSETPEGLSMGEEVVDENAPGTLFVADTFDSWELRCTRVEEGQKEPCHLFQLMKDASDSPIAEINIFVMPNGGQAVAGGTIVVPLETLLTKQVTLSVDSGTKKRYPFRFCSIIGCYAPIGFSNADIASYKRGNEVALTIVHASYPDDTLLVKLSLTGFTKAYEALQAEQ